MFATHALQHRVLNCRIVPQPVVHGCTAHDVQVAYYACVPEKIYVTNVLANAVSFITDSQVSTFFVDNEAHNGHVNAMTIHPLGSSVTLLFFGPHVNAEQFHIYSVLADLQCTCYSWATTFELHYPNLVDLQLKFTAQSGSSTGHRFSLEEAAAHLGVRHQKLHFDAYHTYCTSNLSMQAIKYASHDVLALQDIAAAPPSAGKYKHCYTIGMFNYRLDDAEMTKLALPPSKLTWCHHPARALSFKQLSEKISSELRQPHTIIDAGSSTDVTVFSHDGSSCVF